MATQVEVGPGVQSAPTPSVNKVPWRERYAPYLILGPALLVTGLVLVPLFISIYWTLTDYRFTRPNYDFVWFENYVRIFTSGNFWHSFRVTFAYAILAVGIEAVIGIVIAFLLNTETLMAKIYRPFLLLPLMIAPLISTLIWRLMMSPEFGLLNYWLSYFGLRDFPWATSPRTAMFTVLLIEVWTFTPFVALLVYAGLKALPREPYEAAEVDGASGRFVFRNITLPLLSPYIAIALVFRLIDSLRQFDIIYGMTKGGPGDTLMNFQVYAYTSTFTYMRPAEGLAYVVVNWIIIYAISYLLVTRWMTPKGKQA